MFDSLFENMLPEGVSIADLVKRFESGLAAFHQIATDLAETKADIAVLLRDAQHIKAAITGEEPAKAPVEDASVSAVETA